MSHADHRVPPDDEMIVQFDPQRPTQGQEVAGRFNVGCAWGGIA